MLTAYIKKQSFPKDIQEFGIVLDTNDEHFEKRLFLNDTTEIWITIVINNVSP
jgi:hypothetical protein